MSGPRNLHRGVGWVLLGGLVATLALFAWSGRESAREGQWFSFAVFLAWAALPFSILFRLRRWAGLNARRVRVVYVGSVLIVGAGLFVYLNALIIQPETQSGLVAFMPFYQTMATALVWLVAFLMGKGGAASPSEAG